MEWASIRIQKGCFGKRLLQLIEITRVPNDDTPVKKKYLYANMNITLEHPSIKNISREAWKKLLFQASTFSVFSSRINRLAKKIINWVSLKESKSYDINIDVVRNYNEPRNEVHDKASGLKMSYKKVVKDGNIEDMINARRLSMEE